MTIIEAGVDYISLHTALWSEQRPMAPDELCKAYIALHESPLLLSYKRVLGYEGYGDDYLFVGQREDGFIRRIAGGAADRLYESTVIQGDNPSRIDLQVTVRIDGNYLETIQTHEAEANIANEALPEKRRRLVHLHKDNKEGCTLYVGSRHSEQFLRIYHKYAKSPEERYKGCIRYEIQLTGKAAAAYAELVLNAGLYRGRAITMLVRQWCLTRGVIALIPSMRENWLPPAIQLPKTNVDTTMIWLRDQVRPAIARLLKSVDRDAILDAIGLASVQPVANAGSTIKEL